MSTISIFFSSLFTHRPHHSTMDPSVPRKIEYAFYALVSAIYFAQMFYHGTFIKFDRQEHFWFTLRMLPLLHFPRALSLYSPDDDDATLCYPSQQCTQYGIISTAAALMLLATTLRLRPPEH